MKPDSPFGHYRPTDPLDEAVQSHHGVDSQLALGGSPIAPDGLSGGPDIKDEGPNGENRTPAEPPREPRLGREEEAMLALEHTRITPRLGWLLSGAFLATIFAVPFVQHGLEMQRNLTARRAEIAATGHAETPLWPRFYNFTGEFPTWAQMSKVRSPQMAWALIPTAEQFKTHEDLLQDDSPLVQWTLPRVQNFVTRLGVGNEQAYCGRVMPDGRQWLHYRPDVDYVTSRGFLDPAFLTARKRTAGEEIVQPDPVRAIVDFRDQLARRGIRLLLMPTPVKAMMQPETLSARATFGQGVVQNPSYAQFLAELKNARVEVFDPSDLIMAEMKRTRQPQYLADDTHWLPGAMELTARVLAQRIGGMKVLPPSEPETYARRTVTVSNRGDIFDMLRLPTWQSFVTPQTVQVHQVRTADGETWFPARSADVLLLGDSFSNIYSLEGMNWGESAGLAEQLSFALKRPVDAITNNAGGSFVTRELLVKELARGRNRLRTKKLVVWQFAMRDLLSGNWKLLDLPSGKRRPHKEAS